MTKEQALELLTPGTLAVAAQVLQAIDVLVEQHFLDKHQKDFAKQLPLSESEVCEIADRQIREFPSLAALLNGNGYHLLTTHVSNCLTSVEMKEQAEILLASRMPSE